MTSVDEPAPPNAATASGPASPGRYSTKAILALVFGVASLLLVLPGALLALLAAVTAVILGHLALRGLPTSGERGREVAVGGLVTSYLTIAVAAVVLIAAIGIGSAATGTGGTVPDACTSKTGDFTSQQLQRCFDQTNGN